MTILFLYSEVMGYTLSTIRSLIKDQGCTIYLVYWDTKKKTPFQLEQIPGLHTHARSTFSTKEELCTWAERLNPDLLYVSGRMDPLYLQAALFFKRKKIPVVSGMDNQWQGTWRQRVAIVLSSLLYRKYFDYLWVAGSLQYAYASRLGYAPEKILPNLYSADTELFVGRVKKNKTSKQRTLLFVGRLDPVKGIEQAIKAFLKVKENISYDWKFKVIGSGPLEGKLQLNSNIEYIPFLSPDQLAVQVENADAFILPSVHERWGVVVHEMAAAGLSL